MTKQEQILDAARQIIKTEGAINLTRSKLCKAVNIPTGSFPHVMGMSFTALMEQLNNEGIKGPTLVQRKGRANPKHRRESILSAAVECSISSGYKNITRQDVAEKAGVSAALVSSYFNTMQQLRRDVIRWAVKRNLYDNTHLNIIGQAIINGESYVKNVDPHVKEQAIQSLSN